MFHWHVPNERNLRSSFEEGLDRHKQPTVTRVAELIKSLVMSWTAGLRMSPLDRQRLGQERVQQILLDKHGPVFGRGHPLYWPSR